jgi:hypothetical protein
VNVSRVTAKDFKTKVPFLKIFGTACHEIALNFRASGSTEAEHQL